MIVKCYKIIFKYQNFIEKKIKGIMETIAQAGEDVLRILVITSYYKGHLKTLI